MSEEGVDEDFEDLIVKKTNLLAAEERKSDKKVTTKV